MCDDVNSNPFAALFTPLNEIGATTSTSESNFPQPTTNSTHSEDHQLDELLANVFGVTLCQENDNKPTKQLVFIDSDSPEHAIFERLLLKDPKSKLIPKETSKKQDIDNHVVQTEIVPYLFESYCRLRRYRIGNGSSETIENMRRIIIQNVSTALQEPDLFSGQEVYSQFISLFMDGEIFATELSTFIADIVEHLNSDNVGNEQQIINNTFGPILDQIHKEAADCNLFSYRKYWFCLLQTFASLEPLAKLIISHSTTKSSIGKAYVYTLLGSLLSLSCLPKFDGGSYDFFYKPTQLQNSTVEGNICTALDNLCDSIYEVFHSLLKCSAEVRHLILQWIGNCLHSNVNRAKLSNSTSGLPTSDVGDGFMLNLGSVLLRLCQPFCDKVTDVKVLRIDPTYCAVEVIDEKESRVRGVHMKKMSSETCLIPTPEGQSRPMADSFGFVTECFFMTHRALNLGYQVVLEKLKETNQDLATINRVYNDAQAGGSSEVVQAINQRMESHLEKYLSLRASLIPRKMLNLLSKFHATTAFWIMQVNVNIIKPQEAERSSYAPKEYKPVTFPLPESVPDTLRCIPEFVVENTVGFLWFVRRWIPNVLEEQGADFLNPILTEIVILMESRTRLNNPHLRAHMAEGLESLLPTNNEMGNQSVQPFSAFQRQQLFTTHPHRHQIVASLLQVFVSIEITGQSVQFDEKFKYRRPMYIVMAYLWEMPEYRRNFEELAQEAEANMESVQPPLFLRFINLLTNDAVFLLDEGLSSMAELKQMLHARENGEWEKLPPHEREEKNASLRHIGQNARFCNILGRETIKTLKTLTSEIKSIFCHPTMVDRIASMLNYLLMQLVGPNKKKLKVKDQKEYDFNPANLVLNICEIYINLSNNDSFTLAVSQDGRSYSPQLFKLAEDVLVRIGGVRFLGDLEVFAKKVENVAHQKKEEEEILVDAPEEFLDPIMMTLMTDPVILPSSKITVDRQTIARHLLSDQTDPFNRTPLTMEMVESDVVVQNRIREWIATKKQERGSTSSEK